LGLIVIVIVSGQIAFLPGNITNSTDVFAYDAKINLRHHLQHLIVNDKTACASPPFVDLIPVVSFYYPLSLFHNFRLVSISTLKRQGGFQEYS
jgi:hypothetical protein